MSAEIHIIVRRRGNPGTEGFRVSTSIPTIFGGATIQSMCSTNPSHSRYPIVDRLPHTMCLGLLSRHIARIGGRLTT
jgi:hypothetical protein